MADYRKEFPNFDPASMPLIPADWTDCSWKNDACPSFMIGDSLCVFVDYANAADREIPEAGTRYSVHPMADGQHTGEAELFASDDWTEILEFCAMGADALNPKERLYFRQRMNLLSAADARELLPEAEGETEFAETLRRIIADEESGR